MSNGGQPRHPWPKAMGVAAIVVAGAAGALILTGHHSTRPGAPAAPEAPKATAAATSGPDIPATPQPETGAGAARATATIVADEPLLVEGTPASAAALVDSWTAPTARPAIERSFASARAGFVHATGGPYRFDTALLAERVTLTGPGTAKVDAWCTEVLLERGTPTSGLYVTEQMNLTWSAGRWLLTSISDKPGPSIVLAGTPTPAPEAAAALDGFLPPAAAEGTEGTQGGQP